MHADLAAGSVLDVSGLTAAKLDTSRLRKHVRVVAFTDEEGLRFSTTFLGSRALTGVHSARTAVTCEQFVCRKLLSAMESSICACSSVAQSVHPVQLSLHALAPAIASR